MKIEPEVACGALYAFEGSGAGGECRPAVDPGAPSAHAPPSIDPLDPPGRGTSSSLLFDCEHFQFIDETAEGDDDGDAADDQAPAEEAEGGGAPAAPLSMEPGPARLRPALRRGGAAPRGAAGRGVTFDEAVTLYADENDGPRTLALTTGPDIVAAAAAAALCCGGASAAEVFYASFEPPAEYRDVPPFEPPAEYRDCAEEEQPPPPPAVVEEQEEEPPPPEEPEPEAAEQPEPEPEAAVAAESGSEQQSSDKLFERFLEAEREFAAADDELSGVFRALEEDAGCGGEGGNGALDDNFFRKLIALLSSAEAAAPPGEPRAPASGPASAEDETEEEEDNSQAHSRTLSEADSDCSISSQDTIIVRLEEGGPAPPEEPPPGDREGAREAAPRQEEEEEDRHDEVFGESLAERPPPPPAAARRCGGGEGEGEESLSRQSSGEQSSASQDPPPDADDSTSSDSRSGEVEEEIRLDDIGYDEEDADDYDEESFRGMARGGNSKIRRIIRRNALQCSTLLRGGGAVLEARRRGEQGGCPPPRPPKSPPLSQESLVEKLKWLTTIDEAKDPPDEAIRPGGFPRPKPPDVILSAAGGVHHHNGGSAPQHSASSEDDAASLRGYHHQQQHFYQQQQQRHAPQGYYAARHDGFHHPSSLPRQRMGFSAPPVQMVQHTLPHRMPLHAGPAWAAEQQQQQQRNATVPRNFRDWRVIQRVNAGRSVPADYVRCPPNGAYAGPPPPPDVTAGPQQQQLQPGPAAAAGGRDELEQFAELDSRRTERLRKRYSMAEGGCDDDDPTFGFARRPSVRGVQAPPHQAVVPPEPRFEEGRGPHHHSAGTWGGAPYAPALHLHRVASSTLPYAHRRPPQDPRYHSYAESVYGAGPAPQPQWATPLLRAAPADERGVPEGASSSPKISSDSLFRHHHHHHHSAVPDSCGANGPPPAHKEDGVIYYSLNV